MARPPSGFRGAPYRPGSHRQRTGLSRLTSRGGRTRPGLNVKNLPSIARGAALLAALPIRSCRRMGVLAHRPPIRTEPRWSSPHRAGAAKAPNCPRTSAPLARAGLRRRPPPPPGRDEETDGPSNRPPDVETRMHDANALSGLIGPGEGDADTLMIKTLTQDSGLISVGSSKNRVTFYNCCRPCCCMFPSRLAGGGEPPKSAGWAVIDHADSCMRIATRSSAHAGSASSRRVGEIAGARLRPDLAKGSAA